MNGIKLIIVPSPPRRMENDAAHPTKALLKNEARDRFPTVKDRIGSVKTNTEI